MTEKEEREFLHQVYGLVTDKRGEHYYVWVVDNGGAARYSGCSPESYFQAAIYALAATPYAIPMFGTKDRGNDVT